MLRNNCSVLRLQINRLVFTNCRNVNNAAQSEIKEVKEKENELFNKTKMSADWNKAREFNEIPGPTKFQLIRGFFPGGMFYKKPLNKFVLILHDIYGDIVKMPGVMGRPDIIMTFNPKDYEIVHRTEGIWPTRRGNELIHYHRTTLKRDFFGDTAGLLTTQGETWGKFRSMVNPVLMQPKIIKLYLSKLAKTNLEFIERIKDIRDPITNEMPDSFEEEINRWTLESVSVVALDKELGLIKSNRSNKEATELFKHLTTMFQLLYELEVKPSPYKYISTPKYRKAVKSMDYIFDFSTNEINLAIERLNKNADIAKPENEKSVLEKLLKIDRKVAIIMAMDMLMSGVDTTSSTFVGILLAIAKSPEKQQKLREEILKVLPEKNSTLTAENMNNLPYLRASIKEGMRLYPLTSGNFRATGQDLVLSGYKINKDTDVAMNNQTVFRNSEHFEQPNEFIPERWLRNNTDSTYPTTKNLNPFAFLPFGFGARMCIGKRIVDLEMEIALIRIIRNFYVEWNYPIDNVFTSYIFNVPNVPLKFKFTDVKE